MRDILECADYESRFFDLRTTIGAITNVGFQGTDPEAHLLIEEKIDLVW